MKCKMIMAHDDGPCQNGEYNTLLVGWKCPICNIYPDMQSVCLVSCCPKCDKKLDRLKKCLECGETFETV